MVFGAFPRLNRKNNSELPKSLEYRAGGDQCEGRHELDVTLPKITFHHGRTTASWEKPHPHEGKLRPFEPTGSQLTKNLDTAGLDTLHRGKPYKMSTDAYGEKRTVVVQDIDAPTDVVLNRILDYDHYHKMVPQTLESEIYKKTLNETSNTETYFTRLKTGMRGFSMEFFVSATHHPAHNSITWRLDYEKESEIDDACGHWYVEPHASSPDTKSRLFYSVDMILGPNVATCVANFINKKAATDATAWVKKFSEKHS